MSPRRAAVLLAQAETALPRMPAAVAVVVAVLIELHRALLDQMRERSWDTLRGDRIRVSTPAKLQLTLVTAARVLTAPTPDERRRYRAAKPARRSLLPQG